MLRVNNELASPGFESAGDEQFVGSFIAFDMPCPNIEVATERNPLTDRCRTIITITSENVTQVRSESPLRRAARAQIMIRDN